MPKRRGHDEGDPMGGPTRTCRGVVGWSSMVADQVARSQAPSAEGRPDPSAFGVLAARSRNQLSGSHPERLRDALDVREGWVSLTTFNPADVGAVQPGQVGERLLREPAFSADLSHPTSEHHGKTGLRHPCNGRP